MRFIRIATIVLTIGSFAAISAYAQDADIDDLLSELNFGEEFSSDGDAEQADEIIAEVNGQKDDADEVVIDESLFGQQDDEMAEDQEAVSEPEDDIVFEEMGAEEAVDSDVVAEADEKVADQPTLTEEPDESAKELAKLMAEQEEVRRQASEKKGTMNYDAGKKALIEEKYEEAAKLLEEARFNIPERPSNDEMLEDIRLSLGVAYTEIARKQMNNDLNYARKNIDQAMALTPENRRAQSTEKRIAAKESRLEKEKKRPKLVTEQPKYSDKYDSVDELLREGRDLYNAGEYNDAEIAFEQVLLLDEYNIEAMRFLRRIEEDRFDIKTVEREATIADMIAMVRDTWNPPILTDVSLPPGQGGETQIDTISAQEKLQKKMEDIIIPSIEFRSANITDVVNFLVDASVAGDPDGIGVNIILKLSVPGSESAAPAPAATESFGGGADDFGFGFDEFDTTETTPASSSYGADVPAITLNLRRINLLNAIKYITEVADLRYRLEDNVVIITPANVVSGRVLTRMYPVQPSILDVIIEEDESNADVGARTGDFIEMGGSKTRMTRSDVKDFFERAGVPFPVGTSITYNQSISQLIVANTVENLENFERILSRLNVIPNQVEIEARFVEVNQDDLEELGFQWFLTDNWEIAQRSSSISPAATEAVIAKADSDGFTKGNRFFVKDGTSGAIQPSSTPLLDSTQTALGGIASFASILTNPELTLVVNALAQKGGTDLLSAPRVTTRSGVNAQIQVVNEIIYPTDFTSESFSGNLDTTVNQGGTLPGGSTAVNLTSPVIVFPDTFSTREVGVILNVTPTVGPDGYTIDLTLVPEVSELTDWIQYGQEPFNIPQPIFGSRKVTTSIVVWDGQTVVLGGLIREDLVKYEDKIPLLGDIPILGRLFTSKGEYSRKKNLLIFVTARLVGPDGKPIQREEVTVDVAEASAL